MCLKLNSIFHQCEETRSKQHKIYMVNAKLPNAEYIPPTRFGVHVGYHTHTDRLTLGSPGLALGLPGFALGLPGFLDTNILVSVTQNACVRGHTQREAPTRVVSRCSGI